MKNLRDYEGLYKLGKKIAAIGTGLTIMFSSIGASAATLTITSPDGTQTTYETDADSISLSTDASGNVIITEIGKENNSEVKQENINIEVITDKEISYEESVSTINNYIEYLKGFNNVTGDKIDINAISKNIWSAYYFLNNDHLSDETKSKLFSEGLISSNWQEIFSNSVEGFDTIGSYWMNTSRYMQLNHQEYNQENLPSLSSLAVSTNDKEAINYIEGNLCKMISCGKELDNDSIKNVWRYLAKDVNGNEPMITSASTGAIDAIKLYHGTLFYNINEHYKRDFNKDISYVAESLNSDVRIESGNFEEIVTVMNDLSNICNRFRNDAENFGTSKKR